METFAEITAHVKKRFNVVHQEKFVLGLEVPADSDGRRQGVFLAEIKDTDDRRVLRLETTVAPLADHDPEKVLRVNLMLRTGYLAVGDLEGVAFLKLCANLPYATLTTAALDYTIERLAVLGDGMEKTLTGGGDYF